MHVVEREKKTMQGRAGRRQVSAKYVAINAGEEGVERIGLKSVREKCEVWQQKEEIGVRVHVETSSSSSIRAWKEREQDFKDSHFPPCTLR